MYREPSKPETNPGQEKAIVPTVSVLECLWLRHANMKRKIIELSQLYAPALRKHLQADAAGGLGAALKLGRLAAADGMETLDLARVHELALLELGIAEATAEELKRSETFFNEAITPIVETHRAARENRSQLKQQGETLNRRTKELAASNRQLQQGILRRKRVEEALKESGVHYAKLLKDSLELQAGLRRLTRQVLAAQEDERRKISSELQDQIAQTLLGINVRLITLQQEAKVNTKGLQDEIASTQRLVARSAKSVRRVARQFGKL